MVIIWDLNNHLLKFIKKASATAAGRVDHPFHKKYYGYVHTILDSFHAGTKIIPDIEGFCSHTHTKRNLVPRVLSYPPSLSLRRAGRREPWERGCTKR